MVVFAEGTGGYVLVTDFRGMALNGLFCADVLRPLHLVPPSLTLSTNTTLTVHSRRVEAGEKFTNNDFLCKCIMQSP